MQIRTTLTISLGYLIIRVSIFYFSFKIFSNFTYDVVLDEIFLEKYDPMMEDEDENEKDGPPDLEDLPPDLEELPPLALEYPSDSDVKQELDDDEPLSNLQVKTYIK